MAAASQQGWDILQQGFQYHPPVAPEVPVADNTAAKIIASGTSTAVNAFLTAARQRQENDLATQRMAQDAALTMERYDVEKRGQDLSYDLGKQRLGIERDRVDDQYDLESRRNDYLNSLDQAKTDLTTQQLELVKRGMGTAAQRAMAAAESRAQLVEAAGKDAEGLGLMDAKFQQEHPMVYAANAYGFKQMYEASPDKFIKGSIQTFIDRAEQSKVSLKGTGKPHSWAEVVRDLQENGPDSAYYKPLQDAGYFKVDETAKTKGTGFFGGGGESVPVKYKVAPQLQRLFDDLKGADFQSFRPSKVSPTGGVVGATPETVDLGVQPKGGGTYDARTTKAGQLNPGADLPTPETSERDDDIAAARRTIAAHPSMADAIKARFSAMYPDADTSVLDSQ